MADGLSIKEVAEQTGLAPGTIRMWEQRHGFPAPRRTASGYRRYDADDVETLRRARAHRQRGLSVSAALERARETGGVSDHPSIYAAVAGTDHGARPQVLRKSTLIALSRAIEHELLARAAAPVLFGAFQRERFYRALEPRYRRMAHNADAATVFADFAALRRPSGAPVEVPIAEGAALANEWAVIVDAPGYAACLLAWEQPGATPEARTTAIAASRRSGPSTRARRAARRRRPRGWRATPTPRTARGSRSCWPTGRWRWSSPCPR